MNLMKDLAKSLYRKHRRVFLFIYIPVLIFFVSVYSVLPYIHVNAQIATSAGTDAVADVGLTNSGSNTSPVVDLGGVTFAFLDALTISAKFPNGKEIIFKTDVGKRESKTPGIEYRATGRSCDGLIYFNQEQKLGFIDIDFKPSASYTNTKGGCEDINDDQSPRAPITIADIGNFDAWFKWGDQNRIQRVDNASGWDFVFANDPNYPNLFVRESETGVCRDVIVVDSDTTMRLYNLNEEGTSKPFDVGDPFSSANAEYKGDPPADANAGNCKYQTKVLDDADSTDIPNNVSLNFASYSIEDRSKPPGTAETNLNGDENPTCETTGGATSLSWLICPIFNILVDSIDTMFRVFIDPLMRFNPIDANNEKDVTVQIWTSFKNIANVLLVLGLIVAIFGQSIGGGVLDAYTAKKMFPRLILAAIFVNLSIYFVSFMIDVSNVTGRTVGQLMTAPLTQSHNFSFEVTGSDTASFLGGSLLALRFVSRLFSTARAGGVGAIISKVWTSVMVPALIITLAIVATLVIRRGFIILFAILSPIAAALYVLPSTEKYAKMWWDNFLKVLIMYPIITAIFAVADVLFVVIRAADNGGGLVGDTSDLVASAVSFIILFVPLALVPFSFKFAGSLVGGVYNFAKQGSDKARAKWLGDPKDKLGREYLANYKYNAAKKRGQRRTQNFGKDAYNKLNDFGNEPAVDADGNPIERGRTSRAARWLARSEATRRAAAQLTNLASGTDLTRLTWEENQLNQEFGEIKDFIKNFGDDTVLRAGMAVQYTTEDAQNGVGYGGKDASQFKVGRWYSASTGNEFSSNDVMASKKLLGNNAAALQADLAYEYSKVDDEQIEHLENYLPKFLENHGFKTPEEQNSILIGAGFQVAQQRRELKHARIKKNEVTGKNELVYNEAALSREFNEKVAPYPGGNMDASTFRKLNRFYENASQVELGMNNLTDKLSVIAANDDISHIERLNQMRELAISEARVAAPGRSRAAAEAIVQQITDASTGATADNAYRRLNNVTGYLGRQEHYETMRNIESVASQYENRMQRSGFYGIAEDGTPINNQASSANGAAKTNEQIEYLVRNTSGRRNGVVTRGANDIPPPTPSQLAQTYASGGDNGGGGNNNRSATVTTVAGTSNPETVRLGAVAGAGPSGTSPANGRQPTVVTNREPITLDYVATAADVAAGRRSANGQVMVEGVRYKRSDPEYVQAIAELGGVVGAGTPATTRQALEALDRLDVRTLGDIANEVPAGPIRQGALQAIADRVTVSSDRTANEVYRQFAEMGGNTISGRDYRLEDAQVGLARLGNTELARLQNTLPEGEIRQVVRAIINTRGDITGNVNTEGQTRFRVKEDTGTVNEEGKQIKRNVDVEFVLPPSAGPLPPSQKNQANIRNLRDQKIRENAEKEISRYRYSAPEPPDVVAKLEINDFLRQLSASGGRSRGGASLYKPEDLDGRVIQQIPSSYIVNFYKAGQSVMADKRTDPKLREQYANITAKLEAEAARRNIKLT